MQLEFDKTMATYLRMQNTDRLRQLEREHIPSNTMQSRDVEYGICLDIEQILMDYLESQGENA